MKKLVMGEARLAEHWGVTPRYVRMMADERVAVRLAGGGFDVLESDRRLIGWLRRDEATQRVKRELIVYQAMTKERALERQERKWLSLTEVRSLIDDAWAELRSAHLSALNAVYRAFAHEMSFDSSDARVRTSRIEAQVNGEMLLARERLEELYGGTLEKLASELRNGILVSTRRVRALSAALGQDRDS